MRTPNLHRANQNRSTKSADGRVATVAARRREKLVQRKNKRTHLTPTGLLMEGVYTNYGKRPFPRSLLLDPQFLRQRLPFPIHQRTSLRIHHDLVRPGTPEALARPLAGGVDAHL